MQTHEKINLELRDAAQLTRLHEDFDHFDGNDDGLMEYEEFVGFLAALQAGMSEPELRLGFGEIDTDHDGAIEFEEFYDWWGS